MPEYIRASGPEPFDIFVGSWNGVATVYNRQGQVLYGAPSVIQIFWESPGYLRYEQDIDSFGEVALESGWCNRHNGTFAAVPDEVVDEALRNNPTLVRVRATLKAQGKRVSGESDDKRYIVQGVESAPGLYLFMIKDLTTSLVYSNNQFFLNANTRQIIGPTLSNSEVADADPYCPISPGFVQTVNVQTFTRISFSVSADNNEGAEATQTDASAAAAAAGAHPSRGDWARVWAKAWVDDEFRQQLEENPTDALSSFAAEHNLDWGGKKFEVGPRPTSLSDDTLRKIVDQSAHEPSECPPPA